MNFQGGVVLVSHDARLIEEVTCRFGRSFVMLLLLCAVPVMCTQASFFVSTILSHFVCMATYNGRLGLSCGFATTKRFASAQSSVIQRFAPEIFETKHARSVAVAVASTSAMFQSGITRALTSRLLCSGSSAPWRLRRLPQRTA